MRKATFFASLFVFAFVLTAGFVITMSEQALAFEPCTAGCIYELYCDDFVGPKCTDPNYPHYLWAINGECLDGDPTHYCFGYFAGCCNK